MDAAVGDVARPAAYMRDPAIRAPPAIGRSREPAERAGRSAVVEEAVFEGASVIRSEVMARKLGTAGGPRRPPGRTDLRPPGGGTRRRAVRPCGGCPQVRAAHNVLAMPV